MILLQIESGICWCRVFSFPPALRELPRRLSSKESTCRAGDSGLIPHNSGCEHPMEKEMVTHSGVLAWEILRTEEPGRLQPVKLQKSQTQLS